MLRSRTNTELVIDELAELLSCDDDERELLRQVVEHYAAGGICLWHDGGIVYTWTDGGVSRRMAAGEGR